MAEQCERTAAVAIDDNAKRIYTDLAHQWRQRADQAEALDRRLTEKRE
jgi:MarR-like DNA-binding transcriptional regulator SgrR of sgrS sRNA